MTTEIQQLKEDIAILQEKLQKLEDAEYKMTLKKTGDCDMVSYNHKYYFRLSFGVGDYYWYKRYIGSCNLMKVEDPEEHRLVEQFYEDTILDTGGIVEDPDAKFIMKQEEVNTVQEKDWTYKVTDEKGETNPYKNYMNSVKNLQENNWYVDPKTLLKSNWEPTQVSAFRYNQRTYIRNGYAGLFAWLVVDKADPIEDVDTLKILENEMNKQKEEYPYKKYTPEETEKSLKDAMKTAKENGVFDEPKPEPETLTLKQLLKKWEIDFAANWAIPKNRASELYEEEVERFIQMFKEWMPDAIAGVHDDWDDGYNSYHNTLMRKLK